METHGRTTIYASYTEKEFLSGTMEQQLAKAIDILYNSLEIHEHNKTESLYLIAYLYGDQDIKNKVKHNRPEINNKSTENWAYAFNDWKKTYLLGKPITYSPINDISSDETSKLNEYVKYENKYSKDLELYDDLFPCGRAFRFVTGSEVNEEDEAPFDLINCDVENTEVAYSNSIKKEQLMAYIETEMQQIERRINPETNEYEYYTHYYQTFNIYTRNYSFIVDYIDGVFVPRLDENEKIIAIPNILKEHKIIEYYFNKYRVSLLEIAKDIFNDINYVESLDKDDIEQFVNAIMVFTNAEVDQNDIDLIKQLGAVSISSTENRQAKVELLQSRLKSLDTQVYYLRKIEALHSILSVPLANNNGEYNNAETGRSALTGQGFTSASIRVLGEEEAFKKSDRKLLKAILKICKSVSNSGIENLKVSEIDTKFSRDMSENLLTKSQALVSLMSAGIPPMVRNEVVGLFSDPLAVTKLQEAYEEAKRQVENELNNLTDDDTENFNSNNEISEQNNNIQDTIEMENQQR